MKNINNRIEAIEHAVLPVPCCSACGNPIGKLRPESEAGFVMNTDPTPEDLARPKKCPQCGHMLWFTLNIGSPETCERVSRNLRLASTETPTIEQKSDECESYVD